MHPLTGQRLDLWRLKNFTGTRMPSAEGTYLFHLVAPNNPADERLVALAEVRDVTPVRDADGKVVAFPAAERVLAACLESIRRVQASAAQQAAAGQQPGVPARLAADRGAAVAIWPGSPSTRAPLTLGTGLAEITVLARLREDRTARSGTSRCGSPTRPAPGVTVQGHRPAHRSAGAAGRVHPEGAAAGGPRHWRTRTRSCRC